MGTNLSFSTARLFTWKQDWFQFSAALSKLLALLEQQCRASQPFFFVDHLRKFSSQSILAGVAAVTHSDRVVPASGGHRLDVCGAGAAHALSTRPAVVLGHHCSEGFGALVALSDVVVRHPVVWPSHVFHKTWRNSRFSGYGFNERINIHIWTDHSVKLHNIIYTGADVNHFTRYQASLMFMVWISKQILNNSWRMDSFRPLDVYLCQTFLAGEPSSQSGPVVQSSHLPLTDFRVN